MSWTVIYRALWSRVWVAALFVLKEIAGLLMSTSEEAGGVGFLCKPGSMLEEDMKKYQSDTSQENGDRRAAADGVEGAQRTASAQATR